MNLRERQEATEMAILSEYACLSSTSRGRCHPEAECDVRTAFQRDRDRVIHSKAFRRLKHKTQVFISPEGDHYRTRLTHTLEVSQIARTAARALRLNEDLTEAVSLGHDLGHTPFGHAGEEALNSIHRGGFRHNLQSLRIVDELEATSAGSRGLNLSWEVRDGILNHPSSAPLAATLEGQIVGFADRMAYINHDIDDALRAGIISLCDLPVACTRVLGERSSSRVDTLVRDLIASSMDGPSIRMSEEVYGAMVALRGFLFDRVYVGSQAKVEEHKAASIVKSMYALFLSEPRILAADLGQDEEPEDIPQAACDYIAGMTDRFITHEYIRHFVPRGWSQPF